MNWDDVQVFLAVARAGQFVAGRADAPGRPRYGSTEGDGPGEGS